MVQPRIVVRFLTVGMTAAASEYALFYVLHRQLQVPLLIANSLSFMVGFSVSFSLNRYWAFNTDSDYKFRMRAQLGFYAALASVNLILSNLLLGLLRFAGLDSLIGKLVTMAIIAIWNYIILKTFIFSEKQSDR